MFDIRMVCPYIFRFRWIIFEIENLYELVRFYDGEGEIILMNDTLAEPKRRVEYDFDRLSSDVNFRNGIYWARDVRSDWYEWMSELRTQAEDVRSMLEYELKP